MMEIVEYMKEQAARHPSIEPVDVIKLCYQAAFGAEHLLEDREAALQYLQSEYDHVQPHPAEPLYESINDGVCRVNLGAWKQRGLPVGWLFRMFEETAPRPYQDGKKLFHDGLKAAENLAAAGVFGFDRSAWDACLKNYSTDHPAPVHHSEAYRRMEKPAYRLVCSRFIRLFSVLEAICAQGGFGENASGRCVVAIDGRCASGKTTLAEQLKLVTGAGVVHMDDFFLPPELRTAKRLQEPGGNVHYERFRQEVLPAMERGEDFSYRCFDCSRMTLDKERQVSWKNILAVEGAYSSHPKLGQYMTLRVFCDVESQEQQRRIVVRDGEEALVTFKERWIPIEENYFAAYKIRERAAVVL